MRASLWGGSAIQIAALRIVHKESGVKVKLNAVVRRILERHGEINQRTLGRALGVAQPTVSLTLAGHRRNPVLQERIAGHFGFHPLRLWGHLYNPAGRRATAHTRRVRHGRRLIDAGRGATDGPAPARIA